MMRTLLAATGAVALLAMTASAGAGEEQPLLVSDDALIDTGYHVYQVHCAVCHGSSGRGDGPYASMLTRRPADLTTLARRNGGVFPLWDVIATISGNELLPAHGTREMPIWGQDLAAEAVGTDAATYVRGRLLELAAWLRHIQRD